jgi:predicted dehydrogenase
MKTHRLGIIGCGDFLRTELDRLKESRNVEVKSVYDTNEQRAASYAAELGASVATPAAMFADDETDIVGIFVPPWVRKELLLEAVAAGKHVITTKPLAPNTADSDAMVAAVEGSGLRCGVIYNRTGNPLIEAYKDIFVSEEIGALALYRQDWLHHYPQWNTWALDPAKNGGPFMDAMIHNLNIARYLMGRPVTKRLFLSESLAHNLTCADTEFMKLDFEAGGSAYLFITWAADLAVPRTDGNYREHIDVNYMITNQGWHLTHSWQDGKQEIRASREGVVRTWPVPNKPVVTTYDSLAASIDDNMPLPRSWPSIQEAREDIALLSGAA